jgi:DNA-binding LacI/PurR family transcriptional regulator
MPDPELEIVGNFEISGGVAGAAQLLDLADPPTAIFAFNDNMAIGAMQTARARGLTVPDDLSIVGFDDIPLASYCSPSLTTLAQPIEEMAAAAVDELVHRLDPDRRRRGAGNYTRVFRPRLVVRESTAPPKHD